MPCKTWYKRGHVSFECGFPKEQNTSGNNLNLSGVNGSGDKRQNGNGYQQRGCYFCDRRDHRIAGCPVGSAMIKMANQTAAGTAPVLGPVAAQHWWGLEEGEVSVAPSSCKWHGTGGNTQDAASSAAMKRLSVNIMVNDEILRTAFS
ncbi:hypothetical protein PI124_g18484 [Phytophthora idaei]|nr:hypothetical protein PI124_g18484 [Phytophthora idaei]